MSTYDRAFHPIEFEDAVPFIGRECLCGNTEENLGLWATFIGVDRESEYPYVCRVLAYKKIVSYKWIAVSTK